MPSPTVIDLDDIVGPDKQVRLGGREYRLPGDIPAELYLKLLRAGQDNPGSEIDLMEDLYSELLALFNDRGEVERLPLSVKQMVMFVGRVYGDEDQPADPPKPQPKAAGTKSSPRRPKSASSTSSPA